jgi:hypothetical protein
MAGQRALFSFMALLWGSSCACVGMPRNALYVPRNALVLAQWQACDSRVPVPADTQLFQSVSRSAGHIRPCTDAGTPEPRRVAT